MFTKMRLAESSSFYEDDDENLPFEGEDEIVCEIEFE